MSAINITVLVGIIGLLIVPQTGLFVPMNSSSGSLQIEVSGVQVIGIECASERIADVQFSAESASLEFFIVHSDYFHQGGLPAVALCQYHIIAQSASYQFTTDRSGIWYLVFANSAQAQIVSYEFTDYLPEEWNVILFNHWTIILSGIGVISIIIFKFVKKRYADKSLWIEKSGTEGVI